MNFSVCGNFFFKGVFGCRQQQKYHRKGDQMPIYEYKCSECNECFEKKQSFNDEPVTVCHRCGAKARRVFKPAPIIFKGSGFYVTDHAKDSEKKTETRKNLLKSPTASKVEPKSDNGSSDKKDNTSTASKKEESAS
jgi:putative FmdB family regulatory protein